MRFFSRRELILQLCFAVFGIRRATATLAFTGSLTGLTAGAQFDVTWSGAVGTSSLTLLSGTTVVNRIASGISTESLLWSPYAFTPAVTYVLQLEDTSGQAATSDEFSMLAAGTNPSSTPMHFTNTEFDITAGAPFNVTWTGAKGSTTLSLQQGDANSINTADVILGDMTNEYVVWTPYATTTAGQYILRLDDTLNDFTHSLVFNMQAAGSGSTSTSSVSPSKPTQTQAPVVHNLSTSSAPSTSDILSSASKANNSKSTSTGSATPTPTPTDSGSTPTSTSTNSATSTPNPPSSNSQNSSSSHSSTTKSTLSSSAKAGIGIACSLAFIFLLTTLFPLYRQWKSSRRRVQELPGSGSAGTLGYRGVVGYFGGDVVEKGGDSGPVEVRGEGRVQELDGYGGRGVV